jgi:GNAT superfamily N-acetyltransferase
VRDGSPVQAAIDEAFTHEWGYSHRPYDDWFGKVLGVPRFDPALCPVVWDGDELAAVSLNYPKRMGNWGWIGTLAVRPAWRSRGVGLALLQESFGRFYARGERTVALGVDAQNPTGATRLYERAGMGVLWQADVWQKEIRAGS